VDKINVDNYNNNLHETAARTSLECDSHEPTCIV